MSTLTYSAIISERSQNGWQPPNLKGRRTKFEVRNLSFWYGGTQALYLSRVPFEKLGLPELGPESVPARTLRWQRRFYQYFALPAVLYAGLVQVIRKSLNGHEEEAHQREKETGLRAQL